jgi:hypothetical protein
VTDVYVRVQAILEAQKDLLTQDELHPESLFGKDAALVGFRTYDVVRTRIGVGVTNLGLAAQISKQTTQSFKLGLHLVALRSALLATARGLWLVLPHLSEERVARSAGVVVADRRRGREAMQNAGDAVGPSDPLGEAFEGVAERFDRARTDIQNELQRVGLSARLPPRESDLVTQLGEAVDVYYGSGGEAKKDTGLLWNASSGISHGERWFPDLGDPMAEAVTLRSLDVVCSGLNLLHIHTLMGLAWPDGRVSIGPSR